MRALLAVAAASFLVAACSSTGTPARRPDGGNAPVGDFCAEACIQNSDCISGFSCTAHRCTRESQELTCNNQLECQASQSGWTGGCTADNGCPSGFSCVGDFSEGYCAPRSTPTSVCMGLTPDVLTMDKKDGSGQVEVCGNHHAKCYQRACYLGCIRNQECGGETPVCNTATARCECDTGSCVTNASVCNRGVCQCARNEDCTVTSDTCFEGRCGCSSTSVCPQATVHPNTVWVCE